MKRKPPKFKWTGDLDDDCVCRAGGLVAHCECLGLILSIGVDEETGGAEDDGPFESEYWHLGVYRQGPIPLPHENQLFDSSGVGGMITSGDLARALAEAIMAGYLK